MAATHQRQVIYEALTGIHGHPSHDEVYETVRRKIPAISLATVYKNIDTFLECGLVREASPHHGPLRLGTKDHPHYHLVCQSCKSITDIEPEVVGKIHLRHKLQSGFRVERFNVEILGTCTACTDRKSARRTSS